MFTNVAQRVSTTFKRYFKRFRGADKCYFVCFTAAPAIKHTHHAYLSGSLCARLESCGFSCRFIAFSIICVVGVERDAPKEDHSKNK